LTTPSDRDPLWPRPSELQKALSAGRDDQLVLWIALDSPSVIEIAGVAGIDAVIIDLEHSAFGLQAAEAMAIAAERAGMTVLARPGGGDLSQVTRLLDLGVSGIVFPMIESPAQAAAARSALRYPPSGTRGWGGSHVRRVRWTGPEALRTADYLRAANECLLSIFLIETPAGAEAIEEILDAGKPDAVIFGWGDFGVAAGFDPATARTAAEHVYRACRARDIGVARDPATQLAPDFYPGCFTVAGVDSTLISAALQSQVRALRGAPADCDRLASGPSVNPVTGPRRSQ
jgi:2-keto-3-deoxy-L-rhamnonate aldolase RhmA